MRNRIRVAHAAAWLCGGATLAASGSAAAQTTPPACPATTNTVFTSGSSAFQPVLQAAANVLGSAVSIVYQNPGSCQGLDHILEGTKDTDGPMLIAPNVAAAPCSLPTVGSSNPATIDIGFSDVYPSTCSATFDPNLPTPIPSGFADFLGPVQAMTIAVPSASTANIISAEAAYMVFGFAGASGHSIMPWTVPADIFVRSWSSGTLEMIGAAINLPGGKWVNATTTSAQQAGGTSGMQTDILNAATSGGTNATIGILSTSGLKMGIKPLAFQGPGQECSYLPDSSSTATDKINVRQGRYEIWGPEHMVTAVDSNGKPVGQNSNTVAVQTLINALLSSSQAPAAESDAGPVDGGVTTLGDTEVGQIITAISASTVGFVPWCAMQVKRTAEIGAESSYAPPAACSCAFEYANGGPISGHTCTACTAANAATMCTGITPSCHFGYCEAE
jgi:ABC-type phosphate transport system substrate-binding protein